MNQPSPFHSPTMTGRSSALFLAFTTQTKWPFALCCTARCGTTIAFGRMAPVSRTRTYWLGRSTPAGLFTVARSRNVPVVGLYDGSANVIAPVYGKRLPSTISTSTMNLPPSGQLELAGAHVVADALHLVFRDAEVDPHRRQHRDRRELRVLGLR